MSENQTPPPAGEVKILVDTGELKIGIPVRAALAIHRYNIIGWTIFLFFAIGMMNYGFYYEHDIESSVIWRFVGIRIMAPLAIYSFVQLSCSAFSVFALTRTSMRFLYVDVFYVTPFNKLIGIPYCVYMLVTIFTPHTFFISGKHELLKFDMAYLIVAGIVFSYCLLDELLVISYIAGLYFKKIKFVKFLNKNNWIRRLIDMILALLIFAYYCYTIAEFGLSYYKVTFAGTCLVSALMNAFIIKRSLCEPKSFTMKKTLEDIPPQNQKIQTALKIIKLKEDVKAVAAASA